jgi:hypothetical protein
MEGTFINKLKLTRQLIQKIVKLINTDASLTLHVPADIIPLIN